MTTVNADAGGHTPVLIDQVLSALAPRDGGIYVDGTFGAGGYAKAILEKADCRLIAIDRDPRAAVAGRAFEARYGARFRLVEAPFADLEAVLAAVDVRLIDGFDLDLGVSSMQLDEADRGFSFRRDGPLSMRMDADKPDASDLIRVAEADDLRQILKIYGEERHAGRIARAIVAARDVSPIETTGRLAEIIEAAAPVMPGPRRIHPATRAFQAIRIFVNDELGQLVRALNAAERVLAPAGRLAVVTFHSLEDRIVKRFLAARTGRAAGGGSRHAPPAMASAPATFKLLSNKPVEPDDDERATNPRARSARLRAALRTDAPIADGVRSQASFDDDAGLLPQLNLSPNLNQWSPVSQ